jgi:hypothetical protein
MREILAGATPEPENINWIVLDVAFTHTLTLYLVRQRG